MISTIWRVGNLGLAFALELAAIAALGYWGFRAGTSTVMELLLGLGTPAVAIVLWALFAAPKATPGSPVLYWATVVVVFGGAALGLMFAGQHLLGEVFALVVIANLVIVKAQHLSM
ncbi:MAG TPA: YrdB family protein [Pseudonocardiaceae bacterium]|jgi:hypothetical protein|nr:YrdB family protein [Pseudonocardiaceae bacterium]